MGKPLRRKSLREVVAGHHAALDYYAVMAGKPKLEKQITFAPKRDRVRRPVDGQPALPLENEVLSAVGELLAHHPMVMFAVRQNSGALPYDRGGRPVPVWFYKIVRRGDDMTISDYWGFLRSGKPFALECKRAGWQGPSNERETRQQAFLHMVECLGGLSGFVRSADEAAAILA